MSNKVYANNLAFLSPYLSIRNEHLSKRDVKRIKQSLGFKIGAITIVLSITVFLLNLILILIMGLKCNFQLISTYGWSGLAGQIVGFSVCPICIALEVVSLKAKKEDIKIKFCNIGTALLYLGLAGQIVLFIHGDSMMGLTTSGEAISPALMILTLLLIIQPVFWTEAIILNLITVASVFAISIHCAHEHGMVGLFYYIVIPVVFLLISYLIVSTLFYAETQRYCQVQRNEQLYNTAMYDELTRCKNRYALREFLKENHRRWETKSGNLLFIMFDIDNFKEYNDQFSHPGGDFCLRNVADAVRSKFQSPNLDFFRYGGEEFLLFIEIRNKKDAKKLTLDVKNAISGLKIEAPDGAPKEVVTISVGATLIQTPFDFNFDEQISIVDKYLYAAKGAGKDVCCLDGKILK